MPCPAPVSKLPEAIGEGRRVLITEATLPGAGGICVNSLEDRDLGSELAGHGILRRCGFRHDSPDL